MYPKTYTRNHQSVIVHAYEPARYNGQRCYRIDLSGAIPLYFCGSPTLAHQPVTQDITRYWYVPDYGTNDYQFDRDYAAELDRLGAWPTVDDAAL